jgi:hypothetical protein
MTDLSDERKAELREWADPPGSMRVVDSSDIIALLAELARVKGERDAAVGVVAKLEPEAAMAFTLARHIRNTESMSPKEWGLRGLYMLERLRGLNAERYEREVKQSALAARAPARGDAGAGREGNQ